MIRKVSLVGSSVLIALFLNGFTFSWEKPKEVEKNTSSVELSQIQPNEMKAAIKILIELTERLRVDLNSVQALANSLTNQLNSEQLKSQALEQKISALEQNVSTLEQNVSTLEQNISAKISELDKNVSALAKKSSKTPTYKSKSKKEIYKQKDVVCKPQQKVTIIEKKEDSPRIANADSIKKGEEAKKIARELVNNPNVNETNIREQCSTELLKRNIKGKTNMYVDICEATYKLNKKGKE